MNRLVQSIRRRMGHSSSERDRMVELSPDTKPVGRVLLSYATRVWEELAAGKGIHNRHPAAWVNYQTARTFLDLGFAVDVVWHNNPRVKPNRQYDIIYDVSQCLDRLSDDVGPNALRVYSPEFAHWTAHNSRLLARVSALRERRGVVLRPSRVVPMHGAAESAQHMLFRGGIWSTGTYRHLDTAIHSLPQFTGPLLQDPPERKADTRRRFVWLSGSGMVHKGLDLVLEAFARNPDLELDIFGAVENETRFFEAYRHELTKLPNVHLRGWIDTAGDDFAAAASQATGMLHASCSESSCTAIIASMAAGLIPVATVSSDIDLEDFGVCIKDDTVEAVEEALRTVTELPLSICAEMSEAARTAAMSKYGRVGFVDGMRKILPKITGVTAPAEWEDRMTVRIPAMRFTTAPV